MVGVNKDSYLVLEKLPVEYDSRVKGFEVDERPTESYSDIGGLDKQIQEMVEAIVLPMVSLSLFLFKLFNIVKSLESTSLSTNWYRNSLFHIRNF